MTSPNMDEMDRIVIRPRSGSIFFGWDGNRIRGDNMFNEAVQFLVNGNTLLPKPLPIGGRAVGEGEEIGE